MPEIGGINGSAQNVESVVLAACLDKRCLTSWTKYVWLKSQNLS